MKHRILIGTGILGSHAARVFGRTDLGQMAGSLAFPTDVKESTLLDIDISLSADLSDTLSALFHETFEALYMMHGVVYEPPLLRKSLAANARRFFLTHEIFSEVCVTASAFLEPFIGPEGLVIKAWEANQ